MTPEIWCRLVKDFLGRHFHPVAVNHDLDRSVGICTMFGWAAIAVVAARMAFVIVETFVPRVIRAVSMAVVAILRRRCIRNSPAQKH